MTSDTADKSAVRTGKSPSSSPKGSKPSSPKGSKPSSPKGSKPSSLKSGSPESSTAPAGILPAQHWAQVAEQYEVDDSDTASIAESIASSTDSLTSTILKYRKIHGRTYHKDIGNASYWASNDVKQNESMDMNHHVLTLVIGGKFFLAPLETDRIQKVLDIGTGTGSWAIDFADEHPHIEVIGTDISPIQPSWVPPNLKFEIEDCTNDWTFQPESMDYIHMRWLVGSVSDWEAMMAQAYQTLRPGGWLESHETTPVYESDDGTVVEGSALEQWGKIFTNFGESIGRPFTVVHDQLQRKGMEAAGFVDIEEADFKTPVGSWPKDPKLKEIGAYAQVVVESDIEGYILYPATAIGWSAEEVSVYAAHVRSEIRSPKTHPYYRQKIVWGRKPGTPAE